MNDTNPIHGRQRPAPSFMQDENTAENKPLQQLAAPVQVHEAVDSDVQGDAGADLPDTDFSLSVDNVRRLLHEKGINKSKDTIQRYCRDGDLQCRKLGMLKRYYATETSLQNLLKKMQADAPASTFMQVHEGAEETVKAEPEPEIAKDESVENKSETELHEAAHTDVQVHATAYSETIKILQSQIDKKDEQLEKKDEQIAGLITQMDRSQQINLGIQQTFQTSVLALGGKTMDDHDAGKKRENNVGQGDDNRGQ